MYRNGWGLQTSSPEDKCESTYVEFKRHQPPKGGKNKSEEIVEKAREKNLKLSPTYCKMNAIAVKARFSTCQQKGGEFTILSGESFHQPVLEASSPKFCNSLSGVHKWLVIYFSSKEKIGQSKNKSCEKNNRITFRSSALDNFYAAVPSHLFFVLQQKAAKYFAEARSSNMHVW